MQRKKILTIVMVFAILVLSSMMTCVNANAYIPGDITPYIPESEPATYVQNFFGALVWIGYAIVIGMLIFVGMKYMFAAADERASLKGILVKVVIGAIVIAGATVIVQIVYHVATQK